MVVNIRWNKGGQGDFTASRLLGAALNNFMNKVQKASITKGTKYKHVIAPCLRGWGSATYETIDFAKESVDRGL